MNPASVLPLDKDLKKYVEIPKDNDQNAVRGCFSFRDLGSSSFSGGTNCKFEHRDSKTKNLMIPIKDLTVQNSFKLLDPGDEGGGPKYKPVMATAPEQQLATWVTNNVTKDNLPDILKSIGQALDAASASSTDPEQLYSASGSSEDHSSDESADSGTNTG